MLAEAKIGPELIGSLANGLRTFGDKVNSISRVTDAGDATVAFTAKVKQATASYDVLNNAFTKASGNLEELAGTAIDSKSYHDQVSKISKKPVGFKCGLRTGIAGFAIAPEVNEQVLCRNGQYPE